MQLNNVIQRVGWRLWFSCTLQGEEQGSSVCGAVSEQSVLYCEGKDAAPALFPV